VVPRPAVERIVASYGVAPRDVASALRTTQSLALLRLGEVNGYPTALVTVSQVRTRGRAWLWPNEPELRKTAHHGPLAPGLRKVEITDEPKRTGLIVG